MPQQEEVPNKWTGDAATTKASNVISLNAQSRQGTANFTFEALRPGIFRTRFWTALSPLPPFRNCKELAASTQETTSFFEPISKTSSTIQIEDVEATVEFSGAPVVSLRFRDQPTTPIHADLPDRSYVLDGGGVAHYLRHDRQALHVGLGEKAAPMDLTARGFVLSATDCFGYDAHRTDPMYKHVPLLIKATPQGVVGIFSTSHARGFWSVGSEIDGLWGHFKVYRQEYGGLEEYVLVGRTLRDVVRLYADIVGRPVLPPRWAFGYISGGYRYCSVDEPPAHVALAEFAAKLREHDIPCSAHQMSSGYSIAAVAPKVRNVFTWNRHRFPDPERFLAAYHAQGIRLLTNIKPFVLASHPDFEHLRKNKGMFTDPATGEMGLMKLWSAGGGESGLGGHLDFTSRAAYDWWCRGVQMLKKQGVDGMWNDNNEYTLPDDNWTMALDDEELSGPSKERNHVGLWGRALHCELMAKASYEGLLKVAPNERPFVLTRSGTPGTFQYAASSWSGDNMTSWEAMKGANAISLTAGLSLIHCFGHDIGGFEGPQPSPELLLRWIQLGIHSPRFAINCFKTSPQDNQAGDVIEPWMYPEIIPNVRAAIKRRYEILPYIYSLALEGHLTAAPPQRWVGWGCENDPEVWTKFLKDGEEQYWFGDSLMVGGVYRPGETQARLYLPRKHGEDFDYGFVNTNAPYEYFASGQWVTIDSPWRSSIPVLARIGGAVPVGKNVATRTAGEKEAPTAAALPEDDYRGVEIFPPKGSSHGQVFSNTWYDDDGLSPEENISSFTVTYSSTEEKVTVGFRQAEGNSVELSWLHALTFILLPGDERFLVSEQGRPLTRLENDSNGRPCFLMSLDS